MTNTSAPHAYHSYRQPLLFAYVHVSAVKHEKSAIGHRSAYMLNIEPKK
jgi:hypothetical protein